MHGTCGGECRGHNYIHTLEVTNCMRLNELPLFLPDSRWTLPSSKGFELLHPISLPYAAGDTLVLGIETCRRFAIAGFEHKGGLK